MGSSGQTGYSDHRRILSHCNGKGIWHQNKTQTDQRSRDRPGGHALLADLSRTEPDEYKVITACAAPERQKVWKDMDILPISAYHEVFEAYPHCF